MISKIFPEVHKLIEDIKQYSPPLEAEYFDKFIVIKPIALIAAELAESTEYNVLTKFGFISHNYKSEYWAEFKKQINNYKYEDRN